MAPGVESDDRGVAGRRDSTPTRVRCVRRWLFLAGYAAVFVWSSTGAGFPQAAESRCSRGSSAHSWSWRCFTPELRVWRVLVDWIPFTLVFIVYDYSCGVADTLGMPVHVTPQITMDRWIGLGTVPTVWLQQHFLSQRSVHLWQVVPSVDLPEPLRRALRGGGMAVRR